MEKKKNILLILSLAFFITSSAQDFGGQWKGEFIDKSTSFAGWGGDKCEYVLELECKGNAVTGSSYTYFSDGGKRYYTICKLEGFIDKKQKYIEVKETERTKTNVPINIRNCFQVHKLTYFKHGDTATIEGKWEPAPRQQGDCGFGTTVLTRRELKLSYPKLVTTSPKANPEKKLPVIAAKIVPAKPAPSSPAVAKAIVPKVNPPVKKSPANLNANISNTVAKKPAAVRTNTSNIIATDSNLTKKEIQLIKQPLPEKNIVPEKIIAPLGKFEKRNNTLLKTIEVENKAVRVDLYDNGEVDGDSISLFYNGVLLMSSKRLSEKPITLTINVEDNSVNELVMYAENLGTIPPNTALMVVTDGAKRYEVRITSDLEKSGVINFVHKN